MKVQSFNWSERPVKDQIRMMVFGYVKKRRHGKPLGSYLTLPGWDGKRAGTDIDCGIKMGVLTRKTRILGYEREHAWAAHISKHFANMPNVTINAGRVEDSALAPNSLDFAFLDFLGAVDYKLYQWLDQVFAPTLKKGTSFAITVAFGRQEGKLFHRTQHRFTTDLKEDYDWLRSKFPEIYVDEPIIATWLFILKCALRNRPNRIRDILLYHDNPNPPVIVFLFEGIGAVSSPQYPYPDLDVEAVIKRRQVYVKSVPGTRLGKEGFMTKRSEAAVKAYATRRANANALFARRSLSAKKAWQTRRAQATA
jgi:hypothetical protein